MSREEIQMLLGGYATDTLSEAERRALFAAALEDQELFNALANEQALRELLAEPGARGQLLDALEPPRRRWAWVRRPAVLAFAAGTAVLVITSVLILRPARLPLKPPVLMTEALKTPAPPSPAASEYAPPPPAQPLKRAAKLAPPPAIAKTIISAPAGASAQVEIAPLPAAPMARIASNLPPAYTLLLQRPDGQFVPTPPDTILHPGDAVRIRLEPAGSGYLHLFQRDDAGNWQLVFTQPVVSGQPALAPARGTLQYYDPGLKELLAVVSPSREPDLTEWEALEQRPQAGLASDSARAHAAVAVKSAALKSAIRITLDYR